MHEYWIRHILYWKVEIINDAILNKYSYCLEPVKTGCFCVFILVEG